MWMFCFASLAHLVSLRILIADTFFFGGGGEVICIFYVINQNHNKSDEKPMGCMFQNPFPISLLLLY